MQKILVELFKVIGNLVFKLNFDLPNCMSNLLLQFLFGFLQCEYHSSILCALYRVFDLPELLLQILWQWFLVASKDKAPPVMLSKTDLNKHDANPN